MGKKTSNSKLNLNTPKLMRFLYLRILNKLKAFQKYVSASRAIRETGESGQYGEPGNKGSWGQSELFSLEHKMKVRFNLSTPVAHDNG